jgi:hypothetical protein
MPATFEESGICFHYPENWGLEREDNEDGWTVSLQSPGTAFMMICLREDMPTADQIAETALAALREEYPDLEAEECVESLAGQPAIGHDIRFFSLDLTNSCWTRVFYAPHGTVLVMWQATDIELEENGPILKAICASLRVDEE